MTDLREIEDLDPALEAWLAEVREDGDDAPEPDLDAMLSNVRGEIAAAERTKTFWLKTRPTWVRRAIALGAALTMLFVGGLRALRDDLSEVPPLAMGLAVGGLAALLGLSLHQALRPLHRPRSRFGRGALVALTVGCTLLLAALTPHQPPDAAFLGHVGPCLFYGLLMGLPVYAVLRMLDRGSTSTLVAACAAGLLGNFVLQLHCPRGDVGHLMAGHFGVVALFVAGLGLVHGRTSRRA